MWPGFFFYNVIETNIRRKLDIIYFNLFVWYGKVTFRWYDDDIRFVHCTSYIDQHVVLDFYSPSSLKQHSVGRYVDPESTSSCSYSLVLRTNINFIIFHIIIKLSIFHTDFIVILCYVMMTVDIITSQMSIRLVIWTP